ncbi:EAL domain-containing protein [Actinocrispum wychmicini]|uniref:PAS domain S-box-containing protein/diguanylate cyclase (GGDEF)-like protein n=1 Tax=Actinocrispum wychmicini TaxID=1213861 RepID=A0A4V2S5W3_9PSEU|nr:EAL domain-containing protein [Actinocrispum wychmicini]TCO53730.1 PAS domain S-box-containing protein/diguanylate cyclase (GGDEF)-like protein [Actinocrispum wychmicini]
MSKAGAAKGLGRRTRIWYKLAVIGLAFTVPLVAATYLLLDANSQRISFSENELRGLEYLRPLGQLLPDLAAHRSYARQVLSGERPASDLDLRKQRVDADYAALVRADAKLGKDLRTTESDLNASALPATQFRNWRTWNSSEPDRANNEAAHSLLITDVRTLIGYVGQTSNLVLDPELATFNLADATVVHGPELVDQVSQLGDDVDEMVDSGHVSLPDRTKVAAEVALLGHQVDALQNDLFTTFKAGGDSAEAQALRNDLGPRLRTAYMAVTNLATRTTREFVEPEQIQLDRDVYGRAVDRAVSAVNTLWSALIEQEGSMLQVRHSADVQDRTFALLAVLTAFGVTLTLTIWLSRRMSNDVGAVARGAKELAGGDLTKRVQVRSQDEIGAMATAFNGMAHQLQVMVEEQRQAEEQLRAEHDFVDAVLNVAGSLVVVFDTDGRIIRFNRTAEIATGYAFAEVTDQPFWELFLRSDQRAAAEHFFGNLSAVTFPSQFEHVWTRHDGTELRVAWSNAALVDENGAITHVIATGIDVTARRAAERELREAQERFRQAFDNASIGMCLVDLEMRFMQVNRAMCEMFGYTEPELLSMSVADVTHPDDYQADVEAVAGMLAGDTAPYHAEKRYRHADGHIVWGLITACAVRRSESDAPLYFVTQIEDVTERREAEARLVHQALHDSLTGLPNRALLMDRLRQILARSARHPALTAVVFIDLDGFKDINDSLGHDVGDQVLREVGARIHHHVRPSDTVARLGGDEFVVLCTDLRTEQNVVDIAERLTKALAKPAVVGGFEVEVTASIGIALSDGEASSPEEMLRNADAAMYGAKTQGKNRWEIYDETRRARAVDRVAIASSLRQALRDDRFVLHFQPVVELETGLPVAVESLVRLDDPGRGLLPPSAFIQVAEDSGLIVPIGTYVLEQACRQLAEWRAAGVVTQSLRTSVNLSARQATQPDLARTVARALSQANLEPTALALELTETVLMEADTATLRQLEELREMGVDLGIDDFGTGYSSLSYLKRLPVSIIKVDRSFVAGLVTDPSDREIVTAVIRLGQALGLTTIAEGVEDVAQFTVLRELGCDQAQGYLLGRPVAGPPALPSGVAG